MATLNQHFNKMIPALKPPDNRLRAAQELPDLIRDYLEQCTQFQTVDPATRLAGSYAQDMSVTDVKDVDILVHTYGKPEDNDPPAKQVIRELKAALDNLPNMQDALGPWRVSAVQGDIEVTGARRSVHVYFEGSDFHLDIVPFIAPNGLDKPLYVPDKGFNQWIKSDPLGFVRLISDLDNQHGRKVRKLGKLLKHYRNHNMIYMRPKSYWLSALLANAITSSNIDMNEHLPVLFRDLLAAIYAEFTPEFEEANTVPEISDPMLGHNVAHSWQRHDFEAFMRLLDEGKRRMDRAIEAAENGNLTDAVEICQKMFGSEFFPDNVDEEVSKLAAAGLPGSTYISAQGIISATPLPSGRYTQARPTKFYGEETD
jgi:hypothetical protein